MRPHRPVLALLFAMWLPACATTVALGPVGAPSNQRSDGTTTTVTKSPSAPPSPAHSPKPPPKPKPIAEPAFPSEPCPGDPLRGVYHPARLHVLGTCRWFVGTVERLIHEDDGDVHVDVAPASGYQNFLNAGNASAQHGQLVTEIMQGQKLPLPFVGERVAIFGTWVYDADHGWNEIHPIWAIQNRATGAVVYALPPSTPLHDPDAGGSGSGGGGSGSGGGSSTGGGNCDPNYTGACLKDGIGDYDCYGGSGNGPNYTPPGVTIKVVGSDPFGLDADGDGYGCE